MTITVRTLAILVALVAAAIGAGVTLLVREGSKATRTSTPLPDAPTVVTPAELRAAASERPVYWAGELPQRRLEVTVTEGGTFVRYLPTAARVGNEEQALTIATYELGNAWEVAQQAARRKDAREQRLTDGRIAVWRTSRPTSVYLARRDSTILVEVFDPVARKARHLSLSGLIQPVAEE